MKNSVSMLKPAASNPATSPELTEALVASVKAKTATALALLRNASVELKAITFANSFGAEDMVLTDIILKNKNVKTILIPYLIGALDVYKLGLKNNENGDLEVMINEHRSGGLFLIPMGWTEEISYEKYKKIE